VDDHEVAPPGADGDLVGADPRAPARAGRQAPAPTLLARGQDPAEQCLERGAAEREVAALRDREDVLGDQRRRDRVHAAVGEIAECGVGFPVGGGDGHAPV
jgi:hypothetical protein